MSPKRQTEIMTGARLHKIREALRMTQAEFGRELGLSQPEIARKEMGTNSITKCQAIAAEYLYSKSLGQRDTR